MGFSDIVQGEIIVAIRSSFPELSTVVVSTLVHGTFELGVSAIVGPVQYPEYSRLVRLGFFDADLESSPGV
jgi:Ca2+/Na+ antiporter